MSLDDILKRMRNLEHIVVRKEDSKEVKSEMAMIRTETTESNQEVNQRVDFLQICFDSLKSDVSNIKEDVDFLKDVTIKIETDSDYNATTNIRPFIFILNTSDTNINVTYSNEGIAVLNSGNTMYLQQVSDSSLNLISTNVFNNE